MARTRLLTQYSEINEALGAVIYNGDYASIIYQNLRGEIQSFYICAVECSDFYFWSPFNFSYFDQKMDKIVARTSYKANDYLTFYVGSIIAMTVHDGDYRHHRIQKASIYVRTDSPNTTTEQIENQLFVPKFNERSNIIYEKYKFVESPKTTSILDFQNNLTKNLNDYLSFDKLDGNQCWSLYRYLLESKHELDKYQLTEDEKNDIELYIIDKIHAYYKKFPNFNNKGHSFRYYINYDLDDWYRALGKSRIKYFKTKKCKGLISVSKKRTTKTIGYVCSVLNAYKGIPIKCFLKTDYVLEVFQKHFDIYYLNIVADIDLIEELYEVVFNKSKKELVLVRKRY